MTDYNRWQSRGHNFCGHKSPRVIAAIAWPRLSRAMALVQQDLGGNVLRSAAEGVCPRARLGTERRSQNKNVFQTSTEQKQNNRTKFPNKANGPNKTTEQKPTSELLKTNSPRTSNKTKAEQNRKHCSLPCLGPAPLGPSTLGLRPPWQ